jgi:hypothetical protein
VYVCARDGDPSGIGVPARATGGSGCGIQNARSNASGPSFYRLVMRCLGLALLALLASGQARVGRVYGWAGAGWPAAWRGEASGASAPPPGRPDAQMLPICMPLVSRFSKADSDGARQPRANGAANSAPAWPARSMRSQCARSRLRVVYGGLTNSRRSSATGSMRDYEVTTDDGDAT